MKTTFFLIATTALLAYAKEQGGVELPSIFEYGEKKSCEGNAVVAGWCKSPDLECVLLPEFDQYGCACHGNSALCPTECVEGKEASQKTKYGIQCVGIPADEPNYILKETHRKFHCEENAVVSAWCDDFVNEELDCHLFPDLDEYVCYCGKHPACPEECIGGGTPTRKTKHEVRCSGIPVDQPNYIIKGEVKKD